MGDLQGAIADFDSAIRYDPDYAIAYANRGLLRYQQLGDIPGALADLNVAILLNPRDASTYNTRGLIKSIVRTLFRKETETPNFSLVTFP